MFHKVTMSESKKAKTMHPSNVEDDLENKRGQFLVPEDAVKEPKYEDSDKFLHELQCKVNIVCNPFRLVHISTSGSDANGWAICKLTDVNRKKCLFACGSYVAGEDNGLFSPFSTSKITEAKFCFIDTDPHSLACEQTVPFPYHIPCEGCDSSLLDLEMKCLNEIHTRCLLSKSQNSSITCVFFEIILQATGAKISERFLKKLAKLSVHHKFHFIVDEILTGARTGTMTMTETLSDEVKERVKYITLGKWPGIGMILRIEGSSKVSNFVTNGPNY